MPVSDQRVLRVGLLVDDNEVDLLADLHSKTDPREGCVSSRSLTWSFVCQTQSSLQEGCIQFYCSSTLSHNERCSGKKKKDVIIIQITLWTRHYGT